jgi:hypothetical protein
MNPNAEQKWEASKDERIHTLKLETGTEIIVHRAVGFDFPAWFLSGRGFLSGFDRILLKSKDLQAAKEEGLDRVYGTLTRLAKRFDK